MNAATYTHGPKTDDPMIKITAGAAQYFHSDGLGSIIALTNAAGGTDSTVRYDAWGNAIASTVAQPIYGYTGREPDETGLIYYRARYYDPVGGRFTQRDPIGLAGGVNPYVYAAMSPTNLSDAYGLKPNDPVAVAIGLLDPTYVREDSSSGTTPENQPVSTADQASASADEAAASPNTLSGSGYSPRDFTRFPSRIGNVDIRFANNSDQPVLAALVAMVVTAIGQTQNVYPDLVSMTITSTTGGSHAANSAHYGGAAVDIGLINGKPVGSAAVANIVAVMQAFVQAANPYQNLGPTINYVQGSSVSPALAAQHNRHMHFAVKP